MNYSNAAIVRCIIKYRMHAQLIENIWHVRTRNVGIPDSEIAITCRDNIVRRMLPRQSAQLTCESLSVQEIFPTPSDPYELVVNEDGAQAGESVPSVIAVVLSQRTGFGGRRNRGRKYFAGLTEADSEQSRLTALALGEWQLAVNLISSFFAESNALSNLSLGVVHRSLNGNPVPLAAGSFVIITSQTVNSVLGTFRTRIPGHGA